MRFADDSIFERWHGWEDVGPLRTYMRIVLDEMVDDPYPIAPGEQATVIGYDAENLVVAWDNGRGLSLIPGVDKYHIVGLGPDDVVPDEFCEFVGAEKSEEELDKRILRDWEEYHNRDFQNSLGKLLPRLMIPVIIKLSGISPDKKVNVVTATERATLVKLLKGFHLTINGLRDFNEAIITGGGVAVKEINPQNMELKKVKNLRVAGEVIDVDALTGGFNLQIAWSTANLASE